MYIIIYMYILRMYKYEFVYPYIRNYITFPLHLHACIHIWYKSKVSL